MNYISILFIALLTSGCSNSGSPDYDTVNFVKQVQKQQMQPLPAVTPLKEFKINTAPKLPAHSPFASTAVSSVNAEIISSLRPDATRPREALEFKDLSTFTMVGTLKKRDQIWGLVRDANKHVYMVRVGNYIGKNSGKIQKITENSIVVRELVSDWQGGWQDRFVSLFLEEGGKK